RQIPGQSQGRGRLQVPAGHQARIPRAEQRDREGSLRKIEEESQGGPGLCPLLRNRYLLPRNLAVGPIRVIPRNSSVAGSCRCRHPVPDTDRFAAKSTEYWETLRMSTNWATCFATIRVRSPNAARTRFEDPMWSSTVMHACPRVPLPRTTYRKFRS